MDFEELDFFLFVINAPEMESRVVREVTGLSRILWTFLTVAVEILSLSATSVGVANFDPILIFFDMGSL